MAPSANLEKKLGGAAFSIINLSLAIIPGLSKFATEKICIELMQYEKKGAKIDSKMLFFIL